MLLSVVIPAYNEEKTLRDIVEKVARVAIPKEIIVVDDGSRDRTASILEELKTSMAVTLHVAEFRVIHKDNGGKGSAVNTGVRAARGDIVVLQDADLEYDPEDYHALVKPIVAGRAEVVMGSRFLHEQNLWVKDGNWLVYVRNHLGIRLITVLTNWLYWHNATDYEGCYKAFRRDVLQSIPIDATGFEYDNEVICKLLRLGYRVVEVPIRYFPRSYAEGKKIKMRDGVVILWTILKWRVKSINQQKATSA